MRLKSFFSILAGAALIFSACSPEEYEMGAKTYVSDDLVEGIAYTVTPDANDPNTIHLTSHQGSHSLVGHSKRSFSKDHS